MHVTEGAATHATAPNEQCEGSVPCSRAKHRPGDLPASFKSPSKVPTDWAIAPPYNHTWYSPLFWTQSGLPQNLTQLQWWPCSSHHINLLIQLSVTIYTIPSVIKLHPQNIFFFYKPVISTKSSSAICQAVPSLLQLCKCRQLHILTARTLLQVRKYGFIAVYVWLSLD